MQEQSCTKVGGCRCGLGVCAGVLISPGAGIQLCTMKDCARVSPLVMKYGSHASASSSLWSQCSRYHGAILIRDIFNKASTCAFPVAGMGVLSRPVLDGQSAGLGPGVGRPLTSLRGFKNRLTAVLAAWAMLGRRARAVFFDFLRGAWAGRRLFGNLSLRGRLMWRGLTLRRWHGLAALLLVWQSGRLAFKIARYVAKLPERNALWQRLRTANDYEYVGWLVGCGGLYCPSI